MPRKKVPKTWQTLERAVADMFSELFGTKIFRNILSGSNNRRDDGEPRFGDVALPNYIRWVVECKYRSGIGFHRFYDQAQDDAEKAGYPLDNVIVFSKEKGKNPVLATIGAKKLFQILDELRDAGRLDVIFGSEPKTIESKDKDR